MSSCFVLFKLGGDLILPRLRVEFSMLTGSGPGVCGAPRRRIGYPILRNHTGTRKRRCSNDRLCSGLGAWAFHTEPSCLDRARTEFLRTWSPTCTRTGAIWRCTRSPSAGAYTRAIRCLVGLRTSANAAERHGGVRDYAYKKNFKPHRDTTAATYRREAQDALHPFASRRRAR